MLLTLPVLMSGPAAKVCADDVPDTRYTVQWSGIRKHPMEDLLRETSRSETLREHPPPSLPLLRKRMQDDLPRLISVLQAHGFYEAELEAELVTDRSPNRIRFICRPGPRYTFGSQTVEYAGDHPPRSRWTPFLLETDPASTRAIELSEQQMMRFFRNHGHPYPELLDRTYELDPDTKKMNLHYVIDPGPLMTMGDLEIQGLNQVGRKAILRQVNWNPGDVYDQRLVEEFEKNLILTGLFSRVNLAPKQNVEPNSQLDFLLNATERFHRTIRLGGNYRSDVGFGFKSSWEHRNMFGRGERLILDFTLAEEETIASAGLRKPGFQIRNQSLLFGVKAEEERPDAYTSLSFESYVGLEREYSREISTSLGLAYKYSTVEQGDSEENFGLLSLPLLSVWDTTRDELNPVGGHRLVSELTPYTDLLNEDLQFGRIQLTGSRYFMLTRWPQIILAGRATAGGLLGADSEEIPADERYYSGGGGSVRGFSYQSIGPKVDGESVGGSSLLELSVELRTRFTETWGGVVFLDGGMVTRDASPFGNQPMQWGAGAGLRIFTGIGPLRVDLAYPVNPDESQDARLQFYISLGQSF